MALPQDSDLGEIDTAHVVSNVLTPYLLVRVALDETRLTVDWSDALLGLIPRGRRRLEVRRSELRRIGRAHRFFPSRLAAGFVAAVAAWFAPVWLQLPLAALAIVLITLSYVGTVRIETPSTTTTIPVCLLLRNSLDRLIATLERAQPIGGSS